MYCIKGNFVKNRFSIIFYNAKCLFNINKYFAKKVIFFKRERG